MALRRVLAVLVVAGCSAQPPINPISVETSDVCEASRYAQLTGADATDLERVYILGQVRVIRPGQPVDRAFKPERLNFEVGPEGRIARVFCG